MSGNMVVLVTGVAGYWGARLAARLERETNSHVIGLDSESLPDRISDLDFVQADIRNPLLAELLESEAVNIVCHLKFDQVYEKSESAYDLNVQGTKRLLEACAEANVTNIILKSSTFVYGAHPDNSAFLTEDSPLRGSRHYEVTRDLVEIEDYINGFRSQHPEIGVTVLRFANIVGREADTPMTRLLREHSPRILLGFDPMMQLLHEDDVIEALANSVITPISGVFNVAAEGVMPLSRILRLARKVPTQLYHPFAYWGAKRLHKTRLRSFYVPPIEWDYLRYPWVADISKMRDELGFCPTYLMEETLRDFTARQKPQDTPMRTEEAQLRDIIDRRRQARERQPTSSNEERV